MNEPAILRRTVEQYDIAGRECAYDRRQVDGPVSPGARDRVGVQRPRRRRLRRAEQADIRWRLARVVAPLGPQLTDSNVTVLTPPSGSGCEADVRTAANAQLSSSGHPDLSSSSWSPGLSR